MHWLTQWARSYLSIQARGCLVFRAPFPTADQIPHQERAIFPKTVLYQSQLQASQEGKEGRHKGFRQETPGTIFKNSANHIKSVPNPMGHCFRPSGSLLPLPLWTVLLLVNNPLEPKHHPQTNCLRIPEKLIKKQMPLSHLWPTESQPCRGFGTNSPEDLMSSQVWEPLLRKDPL